MGNSVHILRLKKQTEKGAFPPQSSETSSSGRYSPTPESHCAPGQFAPAPAQRWGAGSKSGWSRAESISLALRVILAQCGWRRGRKGFWEGRCRAGLGLTCWSRCIVYIRSHKTEGSVGLTSPLRRQRVELPRVPSDLPSPCFTPPPPPPSPSEVVGRWASPELSAACNGNSLVPAVPRTPSSTPSGDSRACAPPGAIGKGLSERSKARTSPIVCDTV